MTTLEILKAARALIAEPGRWCQGGYAKSASGLPAAPMEPLAHSFCALGACRRVAGGAWAADEAERQLGRVALQMGSIGGRVNRLNDSTDLPTVLDMFDRTIARLEAANV